ncbi:hypothetical protein [Hymenobacter coccineus]|uniref:Uncharacterized protein n=1 Tax=Hymenobacter coccineus TaxID=1908235 RepID=A0A1G1SU96_9BACT|nr:hypothetical protein [Hymenobacter coccineus]OGX82204.1 hypothetical protein BEN49_14365 [Hymenobacter coccineus]
MKTHMVWGLLLGSTGAWAQTVPPATAEAVTIRVVNTCAEKIIVSTTAALDVSATPVQRIEAGQSASLTLPKGLFVTVALAGKFSERVGKVERPGQTFVVKYPAPTRAASQ